MRLAPLSAALAIALALALAPAAGRASDEAAPAPALGAAPAPSISVDAALPAPSLAPGATPPSAVSPVAAPGPNLPMVGLSIAGGFPDLATASLLFRPIPAIRFSLGPSWGYVAWGVQGELTFAPWSGRVTPTLSLGGGKLFRSDLSFLAKDSGGVSSGMKPLLQKVDYDYLHADLGLDFGNPRGFAFFLRLGLSRVRVTANGTATTTRDDGTRVTFRDPALRATLPSLRMGFQYWF
jgi:hypothetical protein